jgi:hypothetical protein
VPCFGVQVLLAAQPSPEKPEHASTDVHATLKAATLAMCPNDLTITPRSEKTCVSISIPPHVLCDPNGFEVGAVVWTSAPLKTGCLLFSIFAAPGIPTKKAQLPAIRRRPLGRCPVTWEGFAHE